MIQAKNVPSPLVPTGTETFVILKSLNVEGLPAVVTLCCGPRAMNLVFVIDQDSPIGDCESAIGIVAGQPSRGGSKMCLILFFLSSFLSSFFSTLH